MKRKVIISIAVFTMVLLLYGIASGAIVNGWLVEKTAPTAIGPKVSEGTRNNPDVDWLAPVGGLLQTVFFDNDPKCGEDGATVVIQRITGLIESFLVPRAPLHNNNCNDTVQALWSSRIFEVEAGDVARADMGGDSGHYWFYFVTSTPSPVPTATNTSIPTETTAPPETPVDVPTETPVPTNTPTLEPTATNTTLTVEPVETVLAPEIPATCMSVTTVPTLPESLPPEGIIVDIYVEMLGEPAGYTLVNGEYTLYFETQPLLGVRIRPNEHYVVKMSETDKGCELGVTPTGMAPVPQPVARNYSLRMPFTGR